MVSGSPQTRSNGTSVVILGLYHVARRFHCRGQRRLAAVTVALGRSLTGAEIHPGAVLAPSVRVWHGQGLVIAEGVEVGSDSALFQGVTLGMKDWRTPTIGKDVVIHAGAVVIGGISVGDGAVIGANAVVLKDVPAHDVVAGVPAVSVKH